MRPILFILGLILLSGCASWFKAELQQITSTAPPPKEVKQMPVARPIEREPGSIWSEASQWNVLYSPPLQRMVGDVITLKPTDSFRMTVAQRAGGSNGFEATQARENTHILAVIKEVLPRQVYRVEAKQSVKVGTRDHEIELAGKIREQDISNDDNGLTDNLFEVDLKVKSESNVAQNEPSTATAEGPQRGLASLSGAPLGSKQDTVEPAAAAAATRSAETAKKEGKK